MTKCETVWVEEPEQYSHSRSLKENRERFRGSIQCRCGKVVELTRVTLYPLQFTTCSGCGCVYDAHGMHCGQRIN